MCTLILWTSDGPVLSESERLSRREMVRDSIRVVLVTSIIGVVVMMVLDHFG
jgi:hypothetical protein